MDNISFDALGALWFVWFVGLDFLHQYCVVSYTLWGIMLFIAILDKTVEWWDFYTIWFAPVFIPALCIAALLDGYIRIRNRKRN